MDKNAFIPTSLYFRGHSGPRTSRSQTAWLVGPQGWDGAAPFCEQPGDGGRPEVGAVREAGTLCKLQSLREAAGLSSGSEPSASLTWALLRAEGQGNKGQSTGR